MPGRRGSEHKDHKGQVSPTFGKAGRPWRPQRPGGGAGCLRSSGGWNTDDELGAGPWEHWGLPGSLVACPQPLRSQMVRSHQGPSLAGSSLNNQDLLVQKSQSMTSWGQAGVRAGEDGVAGVFLI